MDSPKWPLETRSLFENNVDDKEKKEESEANNKKEELKEMDSGIGNESNRYHEHFEYFAYSIHRASGYLLYRGNFVVFFDELNGLLMDIHSIFGHCEKDVMLNVFMKFFTLGARQPLSLQECERVACCCVLCRNNNNNINGDEKVPRCLLPVADFSSWRKVIARLLLSPGPEAKQRFVVAPAGLMQPEETLEFHNLLEKAHYRQQTMDSARKTPCELRSENLACEERTSAERHAVTALLNLSGGPIFLDRADAPAPSNNNNVEQGRSIVEKEAEEEDSPMGMVAVQKEEEEQSDDVRRVFGGYSLHEYRRIHHVCSLAHHLAQLTDNTSVLDAVDHRIHRASGMLLYGGSFVLLEDEVLPLLGEIHLAFGHCEGDVVKEVFDKFFTLGPNFRMSLEDCERVVSPCFLCSGPPANREDMAKCRSLLPSVKVDDWKRVNAVLHLCPTHTRRFYVEPTGYLTADESMAYQAFLIKEWNGRGREAVRKDEEEENNEISGERTKAT